MKGEASSPARLLIADDHVLVREGIRTLLTSEPDLKIIGEAVDGREALELCRELSPDLVLMDVRMPKMDGLEATRAIKVERPQTSVLVVTSHQNPEYLLEAVRAGAAGYVLKEATKRELLEAVRKVLSGESPLNQMLAMQLLRRLTDEADRKTEQPVSRPAEKRHEEALPEALSPRELDVLRLLAQGQTNRQVSQNLSVAVATVKNHVQHIISKLDVSDRTQAAVKAIQLGLIYDREEE
jgi:DNA-binding NarL/FixJ family response regulator